MVESRKGGHEREPSPSKQPAHHSAAIEAMDEIVLTLNPATHDIVKVERLGKDGRRTELSEQECAEFASDDEVDDLVVAVQEAYEAGVVKGLGHQHDFDEADEDLVIWRLLLDSSAKVGPVRRGLRRAMLHRLLLRRLLRRRLAYPPSSQPQRRTPNAEHAVRVQNGSASKSDPHLKTQT
jgi:hypothetical protein